MSENLKVINDAPCRHLLSKGMFINAGLPEGEQVAGDGHVWCQKTAEALGPDRKTASRGACMPGRSCFETIG